MYYVDYSGCFAFVLQRFINTRIDYSSTIQQYRSVYSSVPCIAKAVLRSRLQTRRYSSCIIRSLSEGYGSLKVFLLRHLGPETIFTEDRTTKNAMKEACRTSNIGSRLHQYTIAYKYSYKYEHETWYDESSPELLQYYCYEPGTPGTSTTSRYTAAVGLLHRSITGEHSWSPRWGSRFSSCLL